LQEKNVGLIRVYPLVFERQMWDLLGGMIDERGDHYEVLTRELKQV
jgi:hypothetical protein